VSYTAQKGSQKRELDEKKGPGRSPKPPTFLGRKAPYAARREDKREARVSGNDNGE